MRHAVIFLFIFWVAVLALMINYTEGGENVTEPERTAGRIEVCPEDDNGNDFIQCPQAYGDTPFLDRTARETSREEIIEGQDYSALDRKRLFRPAWTITPEVKTIPEMLKLLKGN